MHILFLCQDVPLDRYVIEAAVADGHRVTLLSQELSHLYRFPGAKVLTGDRRRDHALLSRQRWDAVIDLSGQTPLDITVATAILNGNVNHYTFVSSIAVLAEPLELDADESAPLVELTREQSREYELTRENAAGMLAECERIVADHFAGSYLVARPGYLVVPDQDDEPMAGWLRSLETWRHVVVPEPERPLQLIDVRDFAKWLVRATEARYDGAYFATGPTEPLTLGEFVTTSARVIDPDVEVILGSGSDPGDDEAAGALQDLPAWMRAAPEAFMTLDASAALFKGLCCRPLVETLTDTYAWESLLRKYQSQ